MTQWIWSPLGKGLIQPKNGFGTGVSRNPDDMPALRGTNTGGYNHERGGGEGGGVDVSLCCTVRSTWVPLAPTSKCE